MDYTKLAYFYTVAKHSHVTRAAEELHIAQPALTKAIHTLENDLGVQLFHRHGRGLVLSEEGKYLQSRLEEIVPRIERLQQDMEHFKQGARHIVRLNVLAASMMVTQAVVAYRKENRNVNFQFIQNETDTEAHITVATQPAITFNCNASNDLCIFKEPILLAVPTESPYSPLSSIDLAQVKDEAFVSLAGSRGFRSVCDFLCRQAGFHPKTTFESDSYLTVRNFIGAGLGVGFWPAYTWGNEEHPDTVLIPIKTPICERILTVSLHRNRGITPAASDFFAYLDRFLSRSITQNR